MVGKDKIKNRCCIVPKKLNCRKNKQYILKRDEKLNCVYSEIGEIDIVDNIQSFAKQCSLNQLLDRIQILPVHEKISYLQQSDAGVSADLSNMPKDYVEAYLMVQDLKSKNPVLFDRISKGESFDSVVKDIFAPKKEKEIMEVDNNGSN